MSKSILPPAVVRGRRPVATARVRPDRFALYSAAVQEVEADIDFIRRTYRARRRRAPLLLREDFCGTAQLACAWVGGHRARAAWGIDLDPVPLGWGDLHHRQRLGAAAARVQLVHGDVLTARTPPVDAIVAFNFSYSVFKTRALLKRYLQRARAALRPGGMLAVDVFGGLHAPRTIHEQRWIRGKTGPDGRPLPPFVYQWEQARYNAATHELRAHIHFRLRDGTSLRRAFTYDWRLWTVAELRDLMAEAGFALCEVHAHGWTRNGDSDGHYRPVAHIENELGWLAYVVGWR